MAWGCAGTDKGELDPQLLRVENENIESWTGRFLETDTTFDERDELKMFRAGDVLFNKLRPYLAKVFNPRTAGFSGGELLILRPTSKLNSAFLFYRLLSRSFIGIVNSSTEGAKMPRADWEFIGQLLIPIPTLSEQFAISSFLDVKTKQIDTLIAKAVTGIALLTEYRTALITDVVTGKVDVSEYAK
jgi:type I restriction enzyme S subunit